MVLTAIARALVNYVVVSTTHSVLFAIALSMLPRYPFIASQKLHFRLGD